ncbi:hypothetical protein N7495_000177 [Penicillium taxi]|uniref:uncharacterized protein n=1 Tax=Penicillium taxi TaxID=168475 RepID=UPI0025457BD6|nr:uncharacterized protein N7495_000177 [Penicillium taxi]KAJ5907495.1 hypothetical protein N7495_000177 [Penicillium taxi]
MARPYEPPTHIPPFLKQLAPYVKSQQEALQIRQALTSYLRSLIVFDDADPATHTSHLTLCAPTDAIVDVKRIPADLPGLRKEYLKALEANVAARKEFRAASEDVSSLRRQRLSLDRPSKPVDLQEPGAELRDYLLLLRDRRRHNKLQVFHHYLEEFRIKHHGDSEWIGAEEDSSRQLIPEGLDEDIPSLNDTDTDLEGLIHNLERAVVRARARLDREKRLFEKIKAQHDSQGYTSEVPAATKAHALQQTRDALVQWVEERLVSGGDPDESMVQDLSPEQIEEAQSVLNRQKAQITEQYAEYLQARRELLEAASKACQPVTVTAKPSSRTTYKTEIIPAQTPPPNPLDVLSYAKEALVPLTKSHKAMALQKSYLSRLLEKEKSTVLRALGRLSDESHLLPEYPIPARQPLFKHAVAALNSRSSPPQSENHTDDVLSLAEAWAFASSTATADSGEFVEQKLALGSEVARDARSLLEEVYGTLHQDLDGVMHGTHSQDERPKGLWSGLHGRVEMNESS